jgi:hypothetical protein
MAQLLAACMARELGESYARLFGLTTTMSFGAAYLLEGVVMLLLQDLWVKILLL